MSMEKQEGSVPPVAPCVVTHNLALGGAQIAVLRLINCLPDWVRARGGNNAYLPWWGRRHDTNYGTQGYSW